MALPSESVSIQQSSEMPYNAVRTGGFIRPLVIFKGAAPQSTWFPVNTPDYHLHWLQTIFKLETRPNTGTWRLLILDGHGSHTAIDFLWFCKQNQIYLLFLPAHASHVLQPLDLALASLDDASPVKKQRFLTCYNLARLNSSQVPASKPRAKTPPLQPINLAVFTTLKSLPAQIEALSIKKRKKVPVNPNTKFVNIEVIMKARKAAQLLEA
ncbi:hypothetical protein AUEXF2481DRAFT_34698 [Aureobasidium subglaciale EXF-2481]|uniref:DDE-1 domain-containing protein n=1 Tax=Aureobasidium subglaciale (strain EXF-2481) TaxID=1043005 RepID=A0A074YS27_AURSE|nr:uncharacterized protein AUEXF2481DRAFT_34698 [Aureobasidium subglaciale EXF-2481]KER00491.1 hypothetical protein AUEXF2481DRAFT_34698 [Aureobasidium subglaciale EXF-2481]